MLVPPSPFGEGGATDQLVAPVATPTALPDGRPEEILRVALSTGDDPALDVLLLRLHVETACRRGGALALAPEDLDPEDYLIQLQATLGLVEAVKAHELLESGSVTGKIALTV